MAARGVLGLSVWLTYTADRLLDVAGRPFDQLLSVRHRFTKDYSPILWKIWFCVLIVNSSIAFIGLTTDQLINGALLLVVCLLYTGLNQKLSHRFFPKEPCIALIYVAGVIVFLHPVYELLPAVGALTLLCLINCLIISNKEYSIDTAMQINSLAKHLPQIPYALYVVCLGLLLLLDSQMFIPLILSMVALLSVHLFHHRLSIESFRVLADAALLVGPFAYLLAACL